MQRLGSGSILLAFLFCGCAKSGIPMMGLDDNGKYYQYFVAEDKYVEKLQNVVEISNEALGPALAQSQASPSKWGLHTVVLGLGLKMEFGAGPVIKMGVTPRFRLAYSNSPSPVIP